MMAGRKSLKRFKVTALVGAGAIALALGATPAMAQQRTYDLRSQSLSQSLRDYGRISGTQIIFTEDVVRGKRAPRVRGTFTSEEALKRILARSGLRAERTPTGAVMVVRSQEASASPVSRPTAPRSAGEAEAGSAAVETESAELIVVTGSRLPQFGADGPTPVTSFSEERIEQLGSSNVADVLDYLPQNTFSFDERGSFGGSRSVQLRGLGAGTTLILVNGRRTVTSSLGAARGNFDLNQIPLVAVERVEVLSTSASAIYGADAVGGVVNVILKDEIERPVIDLYYGFTPEGDSDEKRASLSFGFSSRRFRSAFTLDYFKRTPLFGSERDITADADFRRFGSTDTRSNNANPGNVFSTTAAPLPGLTSTFAAVPRGSTGVGLTPADFRATQGTLNLESLSRFGTIIPESERYSGSAAIEYDLGAGATLFADLLYTKTKDLSFRSPNAVSNALVPANNPFNPFGVPVRVRFLLTGLGSQETDAEAESLRGVLGVRADIGAWNLELAFLATEDNSESDSFGNFVDTVKLNAALRSTDPATALNPFQDGPGGSPELLQSLLADPVGGDPSDSTSRQVSGVASGPLFELPGGTVEIVAGGEMREEGILFVAATDIFGGVLNLEVDRQTEAAFGEVRIPIVGPGMDVPLVERLTVTAAGRYDHYSDFGGTFNPQAALEWDVNRALMFRASYGTSFRAPPLFELYAPPIALPSQIRDPRRNNELVSFTNLIAGNPELDAEEGESWSAGAVYRPEWLPRSRFSVDYFRVKLDQRVQRFLGGDVLANEAVLPGRVVRADPSPADVAAGLPGPIVSIDATSLNFGSVDTDGFDVRADYSHPTGIGTFTANLAATYVLNYDAANLPTTPVVERAGRAHREGSIPEWRAVGTLAWSHRGLSISATGRYTDSYLDATSQNILNGRTIESSFLVDAQIAFDLGEGLRNPGWLDGTALRVGAINLFDKDPPFSEISGAGYDLSQADIRQRFVYVKLSKAF